MNPDPVCKRNGPGSLCKIIDPDPVCKRNVPGSGPRDHFFKKNLSFFVTTFASPSDKTEILKWQ